MDTRGIISVDLLLATFMVMVMMGIMSFLILDIFNMADESQELAEARSLAENVAGAINQAYAGGNGHTIKITTPPYLNNKNNYRVMINSSGVLVKVGGRSGMAFVIPGKISSSKSLKGSQIILLPGRNYVIVNKKEDNGENWIFIDEI
ncbi:MAG: hypothetical protein A4E27_01528 [Methanobacterium sp. PtaU1.Bin242]|nr:MAG: hypothetical protein A4E27_01528 [Methanobacterium sp. PtaU1.Bin242]